MISDMLDKQMTKQFIHFILISRAANHKQCIANNKVPPAVSHRISLRVNCEYSSYSLYG